ncbi:MAG: PEP-CTERM sorting domain-containing protein [Terrimicrobiaceae bacterium]
MKKTLLCAAFSVAAAIITAFPGRAQVITGTGPDLVNLVVQAPQFIGTPLWYQYRYDADSFIDPTDLLRGSDVLVAVANNPLSKLALTFGGSTDSGFFVSSLAYDGGPSVGSDFVNNLYWTYFVADGTVNKVDEVFAPIVDENGLPVVEDSVPAGTWSLAPVGASLRYPVNGSWDALVYGQWGPDPVTSDFVYMGDPPAIAPVPEPSTVALLLVGMAFLVVMWIRRDFFARVRA